MARLSGKVARIVAVSRNGAPVAGADQCMAMDRIDNIGALPVDTVVINLAAQRYDASRFDMAQSDILTANVEIANAVYRFCFAEDCARCERRRALRYMRQGWPCSMIAGRSTFNAPPNTNEAFYAWSKRWSEIIAGLHRDRFGISTVSFRLSNPYGPHDSVDSASAHVLPAFVMRALAPRRGLRH